MPEHTAPVCSIIVPLFNRSVYTRTFLNCLQAVLPKDPPCEVIMVNSGSTDDTAAVLRELGGAYRTISLPTNRNFSGACNTGAAAARGRLLYFLNNDTVPLAGFVETLVAEIDRDSEIGIVGSRLLFPDGTIQHAGIAFDRHGIPTHLYLKSPADAQPVNKRRELQAVTGASLMIRREDFEAVHGFDTIFRNSHEDVDLCLRVRRRGRKVVYCPASTLYHFESASPGRHDHEERNLTLFLARWHDRVVSDEERIYTNDGCATPPRRVADSTTELECALQREQNVRSYWQQRAHTLDMENRALLATFSTRLSEQPLGSNPSDSRVAVLNLELPTDVVAGERLQIGVLLSAMYVDAGSPTVLEFTFECVDPKLSHPAGSISVAKPGLHRVTARVDVPAELGSFELCIRRHDDGFELARLPVQLRARYGVKYDVDLPTALIAGAVGKYPLVLVNQGGEPWECTGKLQLGYRWRRPDGRSLAEIDGRAAIINRRVNPGERLALLATVQAPPTPGSYTLAWDLVEEGVAWYSSRGVEPRHDNVEIRARPASPPEEVDDATVDDLLRHSRSLRDRLALTESKHDRLVAKVDEFETGIDWLRSEVKTEKHWREEALKQLAEQQREAAGLRSRLEQTLIGCDQADAKLRRLEQTRTVRWSNAVRALFRQRSP